MNFNLLFFIRLFVRHIVLLIVLPVLLAVMVFFLTKDQPKTYISTTKIYTGIASGSNIESLDNQRFDFFATNTAFDNMINIINARNTIETVGLRLFTQHMMLDKADPRIISKEKYTHLMEIVPKGIKGLVVTGDVEKTYERFLAEKESGHDNFVYKLINLEHPDYSASKIQKKIIVRRISNSDLLEIKYSSEDPGICQNTLLLLSDVFVKMNSDIKVNQSDAVVKYFLHQLDVSNSKLREAEDELLEFNRTNNIINYYEQTKHIAAQKENFEEEYQKVQMNFAGTESVIAVLESKMNAREKLQISSKEIIETRNKIADLNYKIAMKQLNLAQDSISINKDEATLGEMGIEVEELNSRLRHAIDTLYWGDTNQNGLVTTTILNDWLQNVIAFEGSKAQLKMLDQKRLEFRQLYAEFAPLGATMMRLERKISVAEQEYLSLLHSLGLAKLKQQNIELTSNLKTVDEPYYPIVSEPSKRKILVLVAGFMGFILVAFSILLLEFLDGNLRSATRASAKIGLEVASIFPKINAGEGSSTNNFLEDKAVDTIIRNILFQSNDLHDPGTLPMVNFIISTQDGEGKSFIAERVISKLVALGYKALYVNHENTVSTETFAFNTLAYPVDQRLYRVAELEQLHPDLQQNKIDAYDFIFIEIPSLINHAYPVGLFEKANHIYLVCRANRPWGNADENALKSFSDVVANPKPSIILNGVEAIEMENLLGDLPRKRSWLRKFVKNFIRLRFFSKNKIV